MSGISFSQYEFANGAKIPSERVKATNLKVPFSFALDFSLASSLRPDPSDTNEARQ